jgi:hypothetical protein
MLITPYGEPVPPQEAVKKLKQIDSRLSLKWVPSAAGAYWGIIETYAEHDPRWTRVNSGELPRELAFDLRAMLPPDCSAEEAVGFVERYFRPVGDARKEAAAKVQKIVKTNAEVKEKHIERFMIEQEEKTARTSKHEYEVQLGLEKAHPMVYGVGEGKKRRKAE